MNAQEGAEAHAAHERNERRNERSNERPSEGRLEEKNRGKLVENIAFFARVLRKAGLPIGPGATLEALAALQILGLGEREDFKTALRVIFVKQREQLLIFDQAFEIFWRQRGYIDKMIAAMSPRAPDASAPQRPKAGAARLHEAFFKSARAHPAPLEKIFDARFTASDQETDRKKDFALMSAEEIARAQRAIAALSMECDQIRLRRRRPAPRKTQWGTLDGRATLRRTLRAGSGAISLAYREPKRADPPIVALCDISGSMSEYTQIFLHFLHVLTQKRGKVHAFLFGTRLTNVTRALRAKDIDEALAQCAQETGDWAGGTRIGASLGAFNRLWLRRVAAQGPLCILFTDGLERDRLDVLKAEMERLSKSCRRLIWLNPLLRYNLFQAKASGVRAMLPFADEFRPIHNLDAMADLVAALSRSSSRERRGRSSRE